MIEARRLLRQGTDVRDVSFRLGFYDQSHFINAFRKFTGVSPMRFALAVIPPLLTRGRSRDYAAAMSRCFGVTPPRPMLGRS